MGLSVEEQELHISMMRGDERFTVYASNTLYINRLDKYVARNSDWKVEDVAKANGEVVAKTYSAPVKYLLLREKLPPKRELTEDEKEALRERMQKMQEARKQSLENKQ